MSDPHDSDELALEYRAALLAFLSGAGEEALERGYEVGRKAMAAGLGLLDMAAMQERTLSAHLLTLPAAEGVATARRAFAFFSEGLAPFEMGLRGFKEANATLQRLNQTLESNNAELGRARDEAERRADDLQRLASAECRARLELQETHEHLKKAQSQLVQAEKLASLGQLVAGVAHEMNNPLAFVSNNVAVMQRDVTNLRDLLRMYQGADGVLAEKAPETSARIHELAERMDLGYTLDNLEELQRRSRDGLRRIQQIVLDLRNFARLDEGDLHEVDLNAGVESTLNIIGARAKEQRVTLHKDMGPLPPVQCYPAKINQVVLNLVVNAIDACSDGGGGEVTVRTRATPDGVEIHVVDNGSGIRPEHRDKIFDPFFTTKPPGKGTGLGLSISHGIVADHRGHIEVESAPGQGTHFTVYLPARSRTIDNPRKAGF